MSDPSQSPSSAGGAEKSEVQEPIVLVIAGQIIRAEEADAPTLYETNRGVANLGHATAVVELSRVERSGISAETTEADAEAQDAEEAAEGEASREEAPVNSRTKIRKRRIFDLVHPNGQGGTSRTLEDKALAAPAWYMKPVTKTTHAGAYGLKRASGTMGIGRGRGEWKVLPVDLKNGPRYEAKKQPKTAPLFQVTKGKDGRYEWKDGEGKVLAVEDGGSGIRGKEGEEEEEEEEELLEYRLQTTGPMERKLLDALVGMWCCRVWEESTERQPEIYGAREKRKSNLREAKAAERDLVK